jgi:nitrate reductase NapAB chaperone NapD
MPDLRRGSKRLPILSYLVLPVVGAADQVARRLTAIPGCEVARAENRDLLILVTETSGDAEEQALRASLAELEGIRSMSLTFGDVVR